VTYRLEPMREEHVAGVAVLETVTNQAPWSERSLHAEVHNPQATYFVALQSDAVVGFAGYWTVVDESHITNVAVHPDHRRKGLARRLMRAILEDAVAKGLTCSTLEVRAGNEAALNLYESLGFVRCGLRKGYYPNNREDAVIMWRYGPQEQPI
jgi:ribosomal-protein-alanine N-acetyltransferase